MSQGRTEDTDNLVVLFNFGHIHIIWSTSFDVGVSSRQ